MTRVLHILDHSLPLHSGYTFRTRAILKAQQALGFEVRGVTGLRHAAAGPETEEIDGLTFHRTPGAASGPVGVREWREIGALARAIEAVARDWRPDVLHAHSPALCGLAAARAARALGLPLVYEIRAFWEDAAVGNGTSREGSVKYRLTRELENRAIAAADAVVTICEGLRGDLVARGIAPEKITVMPNGVDLTLFGDPPPRDDGAGARTGDRRRAGHRLHRQLLRLRGARRSDRGHARARPPPSRTPACCWSAADRWKQRSRRAARPRRRPTRSASPGACRMTRSSATIRCATSWPIRASTAG